MCRKSMFLAVSPLVIFLALVQVIPARATAVQVTTDQIVTVQSGSAVAVTTAENVTGNKDTFAAANLISSSAESPRLTAAFQVTPTIPAGGLTTPQLGPSQPLTTSLTETVPMTGTPSLVDVLNEPVTPTADITGTATVTEEVDIQPLTPIQIITATEAVETPSAITATDTATDATSGDDPALDAAYALPIEGTIIANRTDANIRFFVEGATYELNAQRSIGLNLPRVTAVLNLYNCDAETPESTEGCFWDPYLLDRDGFYEVVEGSGGDAGVLTLQPAGSPPINQVWLQNRTGNRETIFYQDEEIELPPAGIREFATEAGVPALFYLRSCLVLPDRTVCEWSPAEAEAGIYYALEESTLAGSLPNSEIVALDLRPILSKDGETIEAPPQVNCVLQVPVLNVRSGPGLEYQIVAKIRGTDQEPGSVTALGRNESGDWLAVDERIADGGWITASPNFISCTGDVNSLPVAEVTDGRLAPTPEPVVAAPPATEVTDAEGTESEGSAENGEGTGSEAEVTAEPTTPPPLSIPPGLSLLIINNGFEQVIRFTLDQRYRVETGPSEYDMQPGESISLLVYPGQIAFSASTPWRGLSGNNDFFLEPDESRTLWITFVPDPDGSGEWLLQY